MNGMHLTLLGAVQWAFNFVASAAFLTFLSLLIKTRSDSALKLKELANLQRATEQGGIREDNKIALDAERVALERQKEASARADAQYKQVCEDRDYWRTEAITARTVTAERDRLWGEMKTTYAEVYAREKAAYDHQLKE